MPPILVFSHLRWDFVYQRPQHLLSRLASFHPVLFVEEPVFDESASWLETSSPAASITVLRPHSPLAAPGFDDDQLALLGPLVQATLRQHRIEKPIVWFYTPLALPLLDVLRPRAVVFDCMDELSAFKGASAKLREREAALIRRTDLLLTGGPSLYAAKRSLHANVMCLPSAVDARHFAPLAGRPHEMRPAAAPRRLGFFGVIDERLDLPLLAALADAPEGWEIVMVGPVVKIDPATLPRPPNITWLGQQPYEALPALAASWDVCLLPFAINESTRFISPTKTLEYMAAGKPVVSTPVHDVRSLYGDVVDVCDDLPSFIAACRAALDETPQRRAARLQAMQDRVACYSWDRTAEKVHRAIAQLLADEPAASAAIAMDFDPPLPQAMA